MARIETKSCTYNQELNTLCDTAGLDLILISDSDGLPLATSSSDNESIEIHAAVHSKLQNVLNRFSDQLEMLGTSEISIKDDNGKLFVIKPFLYHGTELAVVMVLASSTFPYKRILRKLIRTVQQNWTF